MQLRVYERTQPPEQLVQITGWPGGRIMHLYAGTLPDVMDLIARWARAAQAAAVTQLIQRAGDGELGLALAELYQRFQAAARTLRQSPPQTRP